MSLGLPEAFEVVGLAKSLLSSNLVYKKHQLMVFSLKMLKSTISPRIGALSPHNSLGSGNRVLRNFLVGGTGKISPGELKISNLARKNANWWIFYIKVY